MDYSEFDGQWNLVVIINFLIILNLKHYKKKQACIHVLSVEEAACGFINYANVFLPSAQVTPGR